MLRAQGSTLGGALEPHSKALRVLPRQVLGLECWSLSAEIRSAEGPCMGHLPGCFLQRPIGCVPSSASKRKLDGPGRLWGLVGYPLAASQIPVASCLSCSQALK